MRKIIFLLLIILVIGCKVEDTPDGTSEEVDDDTDEEIEEEIEEEVSEEEVEEEIEEFEPPTIENFVVDADCSGDLSVAGKLRGDVTGVILFAGTENLQIVETTYNTETEWFTAEKSDLDNGEYQYYLRVSLANGSNVKMEIASFNISSCVGITETDPIDGATDIDLDHEIKIMFKGKMNQDSVEDAIDADFDYSDSWEDNTIILDPNELEYEREYYVFIGTDAMDSDDNSLEASYEFVFTTKSVPEPVISEVDVDQLHEDEENLSRYLLDAEASDPDDNTPLTFEWIIDCGYFYDSANIGQSFNGSDEIEWQFNSTADDCDNAEFELTVTNSMDASVTLERDVFE